MEEYVGQIWHRWITRVAKKDYPEAVVSLRSMQKSIGILFRGMGGEAGLDLQSASSDQHTSKRSFLQKIAGTGSHHSHAWVDHSALRLPANIQYFPTLELNQSLYLWLAAIASSTPADASLDWLTRNIMATNSALKKMPGLQPRYIKLVEAHLKERPDIAMMKGVEADNERKIRDALLNRVSLEALVADHKPPAPVVLWLHPDPPVLKTRAAGDQDGESKGGKSKKLESKQKHKGERNDDPDGKSGLLAFRLESLFTRADYAGVDRNTDEDEDEDSQDALDDMETVSVSRNSKSAKHTVKFDLDLPSQEQDDIVLEEGILLPEWNHKQQQLQEDHCQVILMEAKDAVACSLPAHLKGQSRKIKQQFEALMPTRVWKNHQYDGSEMDINAWIQHSADKMRGHVQSDLPVYKQFTNQSRDLACLLLADLSLSTDTSVKDELRVIDVIKETLFLFSEAMSVSEDQFAIYGFSSRRRDHVRMNIIKDFKQRYSDAMRGRIAAITPGYYTRMGAAIRYATKILDKQPAEQKLLLILTDGKPNDLDLYEGRYGIEDTRHSVMQCREKGVRPFCVSIDQEGHEYLPYLFGSGGYIHLRKSQELPKKLPALYAMLTEN